MALTSMATVATATVPNFGLLQAGCGAIHAILVDALAWVPTGFVASHTPSTSKHSLARQESGPGRKDTHEQDSVQLEQGLGLQ